MCFQLATRHEHARFLDFATSLRALRSTSPRPEVTKADVDCESSEFFTKTRAQISSDEGNIEMFHLWRTPSNNDTWKPRKRELEKIDFWILIEVLRIGYIDPQHIRLQDTEIVDLLIGILFIMGSPARSSGKHCFWRKEEKRGEIRSDTCLSRRRRRVLFHFSFYHVLSYRFPVFQLLRSTDEQKQKLIVAQLPTRKSSDTIRRIGLYVW